MISNFKNSEFLQKVNFIKVNEQADFWDDLSLSEQKEIREGIEDLDKGDRIVYKEFLKKIS